MIYKNIFILKENISMVDLEILRTFYYVIKEDSILSAANILKITRSTISKQLLTLENYYGDSLFEKKKKTIILTEKGSQLFNIVQKYIPNLENEAFDLENVTEDRNNLKIITTTGTIGIWLIRKIELLLEEFPKLNISIVTTNDEIDFKKSTADIGILPKVFAENLSHVKVKTVNCKLFASPRYLEKYGMPKDMKDLENHKLISFYSEHEGYIGNIDWHLTKGLPEDKQRETQIKVNSAFLIFEAACRGMGIITIGEDFEYLKNSNLINILPEHNKSFDAFYVMRKSFVQNKLQKRFLEILLDSSNL